MTDGYPVCRLGAVASVQGGFAFKSSDFTETGVPVLKIKNVRLREVDTTEPAYVNQTVAKDTARYFCKTGDLLISMTGSGPQAPNSVVGRVARFTGPSDRYLINQRVGRFVNKAPDKLDQRYLFYVLAQDETLWKLVSVATGSANQANISGSQIESLEVPLPPLAEQKAIAAVLGALDDKIELNRRMNVTLEAMARALFQSWFVDFDPVRAKLDARPPAGLDAATAALFPASFQDSPIGPIPKGWSVKELGELAGIDKGLSYKGDGLADEGGMPMVNLGCFSGRGLFNAAKIKRYTGEYRDRHLVHAGDLVIANTDMTQHRVIIGSPALVPELDGESKFLFTHHVFAVRFKPDAEVWRRYVYFTLLKPEFREIAEGFSTGTTVLALPRDGLVNYSLCLPPLPLVKAFEKQAEPLLAAMHANDHQSRALATLRDTLLPKLLSGELKATG